MGRVPFGPLFQRVVFPSGHFLPILLVDQGLLELVEGFGLKQLGDAHPAFKTSGRLHLIAFPRMMFTLDFCGTWRGSFSLWEVYRGLIFEFGNFTGAICECYKELWYCVDEHVRFHLRHVYCTLLPSHLPQYPLMTWVGRHSLDSDSLKIRILVRSFTPDSILVVPPILSRSDRHGV
jgi:hypothetical protein